MAGHFEVIDAPDGGFRVRLMDAEGELMAESVTFPSIRAARKGIELAREIAGTGRVIDLSNGGDRSNGSGRQPPS